MSIDIRAETIIPFLDAPKHLPVGRNGKRTHKSTLFRWLQQGKGPETFRVGGRVFTTVEALERFIDKCSVGTSAPATIQTTARRQREIAKADKQLDLMGV